MDKFLFTKIGEPELCKLLERAGYAQEQRNLNGNPNGVYVVGTWKDKDRHFTRCSVQPEGAREFSGKSLADIKKILRIPDAV